MIEQCFHLRLLYWPTNQPQWLPARLLCYLILTVGDEIFDFDITNERVAAFAGISVQCGMSWPISPTIWAIGGIVPLREAEIYLQ